MLLLLIDTLTATTTGLCHPSETTALLMGTDLRLPLCMPHTVRRSVQALVEVLSCAHFLKKKKRVRLLLTILTGTSLFTWLHNCQP